MNKKIKELEERERENRNWYLIGDISKTQFEEGIELIGKRKNQLFNELNQINLRIQNLKDTQKWFDWIEKHRGWISNLKDNFTLDEKKEIVKEYLEKITCHFDHKINQHRLVLSLKLPIVNDRFLKDGKNKDGSQSYRILKGNRETETSVPMTKRGRKKKLNLTTNNEVGQEKPTIKTNRLQSSDFFQPQF